MIFQPESKMSVAQTNISILKQTIQKQELQINILKHDYAELKKQYDALVEQTQNNSNSSNSGGTSDPSSP